MSITDYLIDAALVAVVLLQIRWSPLSNKTLLRPLIIVSVAVISYFTTLPTAGNDLVLITALALLGVALGSAAAATTFMRRRPDGIVEGRAGWSAGILWVTGMGLRFAFLIWINHSGAPSLAHFSATHSITGAAAWTDALLAMAVGEVIARTAVLALRRQRVGLHRSAANAAVTA